MTVQLFQEEKQNKVDKPMTVRLRIGHGSGNCVSMEKNMMG
jgi:hypothetical protein